MSRRHPGAAYMDSCPSGPSRRQLVKNAIAIAIAPAVQPQRDPSIHACQTWLACHAECERLKRRSRSLENYLSRIDAWGLSWRQRASIPETAEVDAINDRLDELREQNADLTVALPSVTATTAEGLILKLTVVTATLGQYRTNEARDLLDSVVRDMHAIKGGMAA